MLFDHYIATYMSESNKDENVNKEDNRSDSAKEVDAQKMS